MKAKRPNYFKFKNSRDNGQTGNFLFDTLTTRLLFQHKCWKQCTSDALLSKESTLTIYGTPLKFKHFNEVDVTRYKILHELTTRLLDILPCHFSVHNQLFYSFKFCFEKEKKKKKTKKLINKRNCQLVEFKIQCTSIDIQYKPKFRVSNLLYRWELTLCTASRFIIETEGKKKEKEKEQRTKESIKSIPFKRRFTHRRR